MILKYANYRSRVWQCAWENSPLLHMQINRTFLPLERHPGQRKMMLRSIWIFIDKCVKGTQRRYNRSMPRPGWMGASFSLPGRQLHHPCLPPPHKELIYAAFASVSITSSEAKKSIEPIPCPVPSLMALIIVAEKSRDDSVRDYLHKNATHTTAERFVAVAARQQ